MESAGAADAVIEREDEGGAPQEGLEGPVELAAPALPSVSRRKGNRRPVDEPALPPCSRRPSSGHPLTSPALPPDTVTGGDGGTPREGLEGPTVERTLP